MPLEMMEHLALRSDNLRPTRDFYVNVVGLREGPRPVFDFDGYWLYLGETAVIHLIHYNHDSDGSKFDGIMGRRDKFSDDGSGAVDHVAFRCKDFAGTKQRMDELKVRMKYNYIPDFNISQLFVEDPNGVTVEMNFHGDNGAKAVV